MHRDAHATNAALMARRHAAVPRGVGQAHQAPPPTGMPRVDGVGSSQIVRPEGSESRYGSAGPSRRFGIRRFSCRLES